MDFKKFSIGLTGGIGSGKTFVADIFESLGASIVDTDKIAHQLTAPGGRGIHPIKKAFGEAFIDSKGALDRAKMREHVFTQPSERLRLEGILHPLIRDISFEQAGIATGDYVIFVNPLLIDLPIWQGMGTRILVVDCPQSEQILRVMKRSGLNEQQVRAIINAQATREKRLTFADDVIVNDRPAEEIRKEVELWHARYKQMASLID